LGYASWAQACSVAGQSKHRPGFGQRCSRLGRQFFIGPNALAGIRFTPNQVQPDQSNPILQAFPQAPGDSAQHLQGKIGRLLDQEKKAFLIECP
jgi:hypothetical protein